jgi:competence protein ComFB
MEVLVNCMEHLVDEQLKEYIKDKGICACDKCIIDMKAYALNKLPAYYIISEKGYIYNKIDQMKVQFRVDVLKYIIEAVEIVSKYPRHEKP